MARKSRKVDYVNVGNKENLVTEAENQCEKVSLHHSSASCSAPPFTPVSSGFPMRVKRTEKEIR